MGTGKEISLPDKGAIVALNKEGLSLRTISKRVGVSRSAVGKFLRKFKETKSFDNRPRSGRPRASTPAQDKKLERLCLKDRRKSVPEHNKAWKKEKRVSVTPRTVNNRLLAANLPARTPRRKSLKSELIKAKRLKFAEDHLNWTVGDWR